MIRYNLPSVGKSLRKRAVRPMQICGELHNMNKQHLLIFFLLLLLVACTPEETAVTPDTLVDEGAAAQAEPTALPIPTDAPTSVPTAEPIVADVVSEEVADEAYPVPTAVIASEEAYPIPTDAPAESAYPVATAMPEPVPTEEPAVRVWDRDKFGYGIQSHAVVGDPAYAMTVVSDQLGLQWVKVQMRWETVQPTPDITDWGIWDSVVNEAHDKGLYLMFSIVTSPPWTRATGDPHGPPDDRGLYYDFLSDVLHRYPGKVHAVEIWNEQNLDREWQTDKGVDPVDYVDFLRGAYETVKQVDESVIVISGALAPTGYHDAEKIIAMSDFIWTDEAIELGMLDYVDCVGVHHNGYNLPPDVAFDEVDRAGAAEDQVFTGPWDNPHYSWSFKSTVDGMAEKVQAVKPDLKLCVTEFGWGSSEGYDEYPEGFEFFQDNTLEEQATWIVQAYEQMRASEDVMIAFLFNLDYGNKGRGPTDDPVPYSIMDTQGIPRPAWGAISGMDKE